MHGTVPGLACAETRCGPPPRSRTSMHGTGRSITPDRAAPWDAPPAGRISGSRHRGQNLVIGGKISSSGKKAPGKKSGWMCAGPHTSGVWPTHITDGGGPLSCAAGAARWTAIVRVRGTARAGGPPAARRRPSRAPEVSWAPTPPGSATSPAPTPRAAPCPRPRPRPPTPPATRGRRLLLRRRRRIRARRRRRPAGPSPA